MDRRHFLAGLASVTGALGGCVAVPSTTRSPRRVESVAGVDLPLGRDRIQVGGLVGAAIDPVVDPAVARNWTGVGGANGPRLTDSDPVIGLRRGGRARAYPLRIVSAHEVVNDYLGGPVLVTYCPLCDSAVTAVRTVGGRETTFRASGKLWRSNLLMTDAATASLWSQLAATAVRGPMTGARLTLVPSTLTTWGEWRRTHPTSGVLLPPPLSETKYGTTEGASYGTPPDAGEVDPKRTEPSHRTQVIGVVVDGQAMAYPRPAVRRAGGVVNDAVGDVPILVAVTRAGPLVAYDRRVDGTVVEFEPGERPTRVRGGGSRWLVATGTAIDGPYERTTLDRATDVPQMAAESWRDFHPETTVYGDEST